MFAQVEARSEGQAPRFKAQLVLARHGKSFHWAGRFLDPTTFQDAAILYAFCRFVDDAVDAAAGVAEAQAAIAAAKASFLSETCASGVVADFMDLAERHRLDARLPLDLIEGVASDIGAVRIPSRNELLRYSYRVAGTVGAMMCPLIGVKDPRAIPFAVDLGIAMQLTNIARDVLEDALRGRLYLPAEELPGEVTCDGLVRGVKDQRAAATRVVQSLLALAERYYRSADRGLRFIPLRSRLAILIAGRVYRAIGLRVLAQPSLIWEGRAVISRREKAVRSAGAAIELLIKPALLDLGPVRSHEHGLHLALSGLVPA